MIHLITGVPGSGKTLYALNYVVDMAKKGAEVEGVKVERPVYYDGISNLKLPWVPLDDATKWMACPPASIIVLDEAQRIFRLRSVGAAVPEHVAALETHRHGGVDIVIITQHPKLLDTNVRRLVGRHFHVVRAFGTKSATIHEFGEVRESVDKSREGSVRHQFIYPKEAFNWYHSAEVHTHKRRIPMRVFILIGIPFCIALLAWFAAKQLSPSSSADRVKSQLKVGDSSTTGSTLSRPRTRKELIRDYLESREPLLPGLLHTAPVYAKVSDVKAMPAPSACIQSAKRGCECFTEQATRLPVPKEVCVQIVKYGWFDETRERVTSTRRDSEGIVNVIPSNAPKAANAASAPSAAPAVPTAAVIDSEIQNGSHIRRGGVAKK